MMDRGQRQALREIAERAAESTPRYATRTTQWQLQTSNSFRRIGTEGFGDGDVICAVTSRHDGHPDLLAKPGVLEFVVAANPSVVLDLLDEIQRLEELLCVQSPI